ncbi:MAG: hypothetical protein HDR72_04075 [Ruminococcaceae bacterium]|nr:hypothetical protein [Oscillospiraceae bacterium]
MTKQRKSYSAASIYDMYQPKPTESIVLIWRSVFADSSAALPIYLLFITNAQEYTGEVLFSAAVILYLFFNEDPEKGLTLGNLS